MSTTRLSLESEIKEIREILASIPPNFQRASGCW